MTHDIQLLFTINIFIYACSMVAWSDPLRFSAQHETAHHRLRSRRSVALGGCERSGTIFLVSKDIFDLLLHAVFDYSFENT